ncbi:hypothetical protein [uncultured Polaribacter sp.]|uniref:hypothetical protein n=1 Tax=uncultured Polaribacter sp. TaxID=174711 RepID=UPI00260EFE9C|nr:hypothetical protein [uncultured Polaribacter sp.]
MKKNILILISSLFLLGCYTDYKVTEFGGRRSKREYKKHLWRAINPKRVGIDINVLYTRTHTYKNGVPYSYKDDNIVYYHFYKNGVFYIFYKKPGEKLNETSFNPKKGDIAFITSNLLGKYSLRYYNAVDGGNFDFIKKIKMKGDTLTIPFKYHGNKYIDYFKKVKVPKEWLDYEPDY